MDFKDKIAVITGGASGIGRAIAERCIQEKMRVVLADIEKPVLDKTRDELASQGAEVIAIPTDVSKTEDMEALANKTLEQFGAIHLLVNNAGVWGGHVSTGTLADWKWVLGVNLWGVIHGINIFLPMMLDQDTEAYIVNTSSIAGLVSGGPGGIYNVSKHAVVALSETLTFELAQMKSKVKVFVLCPGFVSTHIYEPERNRPTHLQNIAQPKESSVQDEEERKAIAEGIKAGISPKEVADRVFHAFETDEFYILTHPELNSEIQQRMENILGHPVLN